MLKIYFLSIGIFFASSTYLHGWNNTIINNSDYQIAVTIQYAGKSICLTQDIYSMKPKETQKLKAGVCCARSIAVSVWYKTGNRKDYTIKPPTAGIKMTCRSFTVTINNTANPEEVEINCKLN